VEGEVQEGGWW